MLNRYTSLPSSTNNGSQTQARIAEEAGAVAVMALERVPADIRAQGGVARMSDPKMIKEIMAAVTIPVMAKARIGHFVECQVRPSSLLSFPQPQFRTDTGTDPRSNRRRLHRRVRGPHARRPRPPRRETPLQRSLRLRVPEPGRSPPPHL